MKRLFGLSASLFLLLFSSIVLNGQQLIVQTDAGKQLLSRMDLESLPHVKVTASEHSSAIWDLAKARGLFTLGTSRGGRTSPTPFVPSLLLRRNL